MREIKFRAWEKRVNRIYYVTRIAYMHGGMSVFGEDKDHWASELRGDEFVLMQYTGLNDMDGKEVYEGDLLKDGSGRIWEVKHGDYELEIGLGSFRRLKVPNHGFYLQSERYIEKITESGYIGLVGNIYENPDLLKGTK